MAVCPSFLYLVSFLFRYVSVTLKSKKKKIIIIILFLQKCLLNSSPHFIRLLLELLNLIGCRGKIKS